MQQREQGISKYIPGLDAATRVKRLGYPFPARMFHAFAQVASPFMYEYGYTPRNFLIDTLFDGVVIGLTFAFNKVANADTATWLTISAFGLGARRVYGQAFIAERRQYR